MTKFFEYYLVRWLENGECVELTQEFNIDNLEGIEGIDYIVEEIYSEETA